METNLVRVAGVRFKTAGKIYYFDPDTYELKNGDNVIVETARGMAYIAAVSGKNRQTWTGYEADRCGIYL